MFALVLFIADKKIAVVDTEKINYEEDDEENVRVLHGRKHYWAKIIKESHDREWLEGLDVSEEGTLFTNIKCGVKTNIAKTKKSDNNTDIALKKNVAKERNLKVMERIKKLHCTVPSNDKKFDEHVEEDAYNNEYSPNKSTIPGKNAKCNEIVASTSVQFKGIKPKKVRVGNELLNELFDEATSMNTCEGLTVSNEKQRNVDDLKRSEKVGRIKDARKAEKLNMEERERDKLGNGANGQFDSIKSQVNAAGLKNNGKKEVKMDTEQDEFRKSYHLKKLKSEHKKKVGSILNTEQGVEGKNQNADEGKHLKLQQKKEPDAKLKANLDGGVESFPSSTKQSNHNLHIKQLGETKASKIKEKNSVEVNKPKKTESKKKELKKPNKWTVEEVSFESMPTIGKELETGKIIEKRGNDLFRSTEKHGGAKRKYNEEQYNPAKKMKHSRGEKAIGDLEEVDYEDDGEREKHTEAAENGDEKQEVHDIGEVVKEDGAFREKPSQERMEDIVVDKDEAREKQIIGDMEENLDEDDAVQNMPTKKIKNAAELSRDDVGKGGNAKRHDIENYSDTNEDQVAEQLKNTTKEVRDVEEFPINKKMPFSEIDETIKGKNLQLKQNEKLNMNLKANYDGQGKSGMAEKKSLERKTASEIKVEMKTKQDRNIRYRKTDGAKVVKLEPHNEIGSKRKSNQNGFIESQPPTSGEWNRNLHPEKSVQPKANGSNKPKILSVERVSYKHVAAISGKGKDTKEKDEQKKKKADTDLERTEEDDEYQEKTVAASSNKEVKEDDKLQKASPGGDKFNTFNDGQERQELDYTEETMGDHEAESQSDSASETGSTTLITVNKNDKAQNERKLDPVIDTDSDEDKDKEHLGDQEKEFQNVRHRIKKKRKQIFSDTNSDVDANGDEDNSTDSASKKALSSRINILSDQLPSLTADIVKYFKVYAEILQTKYEAEARKNAGKMNVIELGHNTNIFVDRDDLEHVLEFKHDQELCNMSANGRGVRPGIPPEVKDVVFSMNYINVSYH